MLLSLTASSTQQAVHLFQQRSVGILHGNTVTTLQCLGYSQLLSQFEIRQPIIQYHSHVHLVSSEIGGSRQATAIAHFFSSLTVCQLPSSCTLVKSILLCTVCTAKWPPDGVMLCLNILATLYSLTFWFYVLTNKYTKHCMWIKTGYITKTGTWKLETIPGQIRSSHILWLLIN